MAADESLLERSGETPVLRIYRWLEPAISFGYFTRLAELRAEGRRALVRRWTGGGIVEHGADFTYALVIPRRELGTWGAPGQTYQLLHHALARALAQAGVEAKPLPEEIRPANLQSGQTPGCYCFAHPVAHDLMNGDRKLAGAAQRRTRRGLLHQGSVQGCDALGSDPGGWRERLAQSLPRALCATPVQRSLTSAEMEGASRLAEAKYATQAWLERW
jgi:lipoate-protein ligase A